MRHRLLRIIICGVGCFCAGAWAIGSGPQTITFNQPDDVTFASPAPVVTFSATGGLSGNPITYASSTPSVCTVSSSHANILAAGLCTITANQAGTATYDPATPVTRTFTVRKGHLSLTLDPIGNKRVGDPQFLAIVHSPSGSGAIAVTSGSPAVCSVGGLGNITFTILHVGTCVVKASQAADSNWNAGEAQVSLTIQKGLGLQQPGAQPAASVGDVVMPIVTPSGSSAALGFSAISTATCTTKNISPTAAAVTLMTTGTCGLVVSQDGDADHESGGPFIFSIAVNDKTVEASVNARTDFDGNGRNDLVWQRVDGLSGLWLMDSFTQIGGGLLFGAGTGWSYLMAGDLNGDGHADILWKHSDGRIAVWLMNGFTQVGGAVLQGPGSGWIPMMLGDINGDGRQDILWQHTDGTTAVWLMDGITTIGSATLIGANTHWSPRHMADFNGDGKADIIWDNPDGRTALWLMNGTSQIGGTVLWSTNNGWSVRMTGDFNGDGKADLVWENTDGRTSMWLMDGTTELESRTLISVGTGWRATRVGDLDGDGKSDIIWQRNDGTIAAWLMNGTTQVGGALLASSSAGLIVKRAADFDGDGKADLMMQSVDGSYAMWTMNGTASTIHPIMPANLGWVLMK